MDAQRGIVSIYKNGVAGKPQSTAHTFHWQHGSSGEDRKLIGLDRSDVTRKGWDIISDLKISGLHNVVDGGSITEMREEHVQCKKGS